MTKILRNLRCAPPTIAEFLFVWLLDQGRSGGLKQLGHEETPDTAVDAEVVVEEQPVVSILTGQRYVRGDGNGVDVYDVIASRVAPDLIGAQMMGILRSTAFVLTHAGTGSPLSLRSCAWAALGKRPSPATSAMAERRAP